MHAIRANTKVIAWSLPGLVVALLGAAIVYRAYRVHVIAGATTIDTATGIDETLFAGIGGIEQWISIRGQRRDNPVLLVVHGGPGFALSLLPRHTFFEWTKDFTLALWDQRGAGKTFGRSGPVDRGVTIERMALDGVEVAEFLRAKLRKPKIILVGVSWGSSLGVHMAKARPDLFYAYVGTGQSVNQYKYKAIAYARLLAEARLRNDRRAIDELEANGPPPYDSMSRETVYTKWATAYEPGTPSRCEAASTVLFESEDGWRDLRDYVRGLTTSDAQFGEQIKKVDLPSLGTDFAVPFFVFQGAEDNVTPVAAVQAYMDRIMAPRKQLVLIAGAGHNVIATRKQEFLKLLTEGVRPLAVQSSDQP
jgi:pimeloyl-ACP methyl ester carboxylesterase